MKWRNLFDTWGLPVTYGGHFPWEKLITRKLNKHWWLRGHVHLLHGIGDIMQLDLPWWHCWIKLDRQSLCSLGLSANQPAVLFSHTKLAPATSQSAVLFSHNKSAPAISHSQASTTIRVTEILFHLCSFYLEMQCVEGVRSASGDQAWRARSLTAPWASTNLASAMDVFRLDTWNWIRITTF